MNAGMYAYPSTLETVDNGVDLIIVDSGVRDTHIEFNNGQVIHKLGNGPPMTVTYNETSNTTTITYESHGTHVSGIAAGINYGASKGTKIYDYQVCETEGCPLYLIWLKISLKNLNFASRIFAMILIRPVKLFLQIKNVNCILRFTRS